LYGKSLARLQRFTAAILKKRKTQAAQTRVKARIRRGLCYNKERKKTEWGMES